MEQVPLIKIHKRQILPDTPLNEEEILEKIGENSLLYILDIDGIEKDKPNLCTFQKLSKNFDLWLDFGPRNLGDIVDGFMAGATRITIRREFCRQIDVDSIREITENKIYANINLESKQKIVDDELIKILDHKNLNFDVGEFGKTNPTIENIASFAWGKLVGKFGEAGLHCVTVWETDKTYCSYYGR